MIYLIQLVITVMIIGGVPIYLLLWGRNKAAEVYELELIAKEESQKQ